MSEILPLSLAPHAIFLALSLSALFFITRVQMRFSLIIAAAILLGGGTFAAIRLNEGAFHLMRLLAWLGFAYLPAATLAGSLLLFRSRAWARGFGLLLLSAGIAGVAWQAFLVEPNQLTVRRLKIASPKIRSKLRIAFMTDLQSDAFGENEKRVWNALAAEKPDLILLGGDYTHDFTEEARQKVRLATRAHLQSIDFKAPLGVMAIRGNVDTLPWTEMFSGTRVETFTGRTTLRFEGGLAVTLLSNEESFDTKLKIPPVEGFHLVLGHSPDYSLGPVSADLMLAGHTHGGQVRLPWFGPLVTSSKLPRLACDGESRFPDGRRLFVSRGAGFERKHAPRIRFLCPPEIVVLDLGPAGSAGPAS
ncbi:MAG TPA: metallophosphoesterase [Candidatus Ozemobacteraceae bacterium]|nr:metallophosphoesterase [Candidatus Ozemobacteraceae bacterium]